MSTIPVSNIVSINPGVLSAGGNAVDLNGLYLTTTAMVPIGQVVALATQEAVADYFGASSVEARKAGVYFAGPDNKQGTPGALLFAQYNIAAVAAYLRGGNVSNLTLTQLQALNGSLTVNINGTPATGTVSLAGATSFSNAAQIIGKSLGIAGAQIASFTGDVSGTTLNVSAIASGTGSLGAGDVVAGGVSAGTYIVTQLTGPTGGIGTYQVDTAQTVASTAMTAKAPAVTYDSVSGAFTFKSSTAGAASTIAYATGPMATSLLLTSATGAVLSPGADAAAPVPFMNNLKLVSQNWATFSTTFNPDNTGNDVKLQFAQWAAQQNSRFGYVPWDTDAAPAVSGSASSSLGARIKALGYGSCSVNWEPSDLDIEAFVLSIGASLDFSKQNGRTTYAFRSQSGLTPGVFDQSTYSNLLSNGYNAYGAWGSANQQDQFYFDGKVSGDYLWMDSFVNQIWLNNSFQVDLLNLLRVARSVPYTPAGRAMIETALSTTIDAALNFGVMRTGVTLSGTQASEVNAAAGGRDIASTLTTQGWYLLIGDASPTVRQARGTPPMTFFYMDGQSVQKLTLDSIALT